MVKISHQKAPFPQNSSSVQMPSNIIWNGFKTFTKKSSHIAYKVSALAIKEIVSGFNLSAGLTRETTHSLIKGASWTGAFFWGEAKKGAKVTSQVAIKGSAYLNSQLRVISLAANIQLIRSKETCKTFLSDSLISLSKEETKEKINNLTLKSFGYFSLGVAISVTSKQPFIDFFSNLGINYPVMPKPLYNYSRQICLLEKSLPANSHFNRYLINRPLFHGLVLTLFQDGLLKKLPEKLLNRSAPLHSHLVHSQLAKIVRVTLAASLYSVSNTLSSFWSHKLFSPTYFDTTAHLLSRFAAGLILGTILERTGNPLFMIATHAGLNMRFYPENIVPLCPPALE